MHAAPCLQGEQIRLDSLAIELPQLSSPPGVQDGLQAFRPAGPFRSLAIRLQPLRACSPSPAREQIQRQSARDLIIIREDSWSVLQRSGSKLEGSAFVPQGSGRARAIWWDPPGFLQASWVDQAGFRQGSWRNLPGFRQASGGDCPDSVRKPERTVRASTDIRYSSARGTAGFRRGGSVRILQTGKGPARKRGRNRQESGRAPPWSRVGSARFQAQFRSDPPRVPEDFRQGSELRPGSLQKHGASVATTLPYLAGDAATRPYLAGDATARPDSAGASAG
jgi:hypothetical protein